MVDVKKIALSPRFINVPSIHCGTYVVHDILINLIRTKHLRSWSFNCYLACIHRMMDFEVRPRLSTLCYFHLEVSISFQFDYKPSMCNQVRWIGNIIPHILLDRQLCLLEALGWLIQCNHNSLVKRGHMFVCCRFQNICQFFCPK